MNKLEAAEELAKYVERVCEIEESFVEVPTHIKFLRHLLNAYRQAPAMPSPERILAALTHFESFKCDRGDGHISSYLYGEHKTAWSTYDELQKALKGNESGTS